MRASSSATRFFSFWCSDVSSLRVWRCASRSSRSLRSFSSAFSCRRVRSAGEAVALLAQALQLLAVLVAVGRGAVGVPGQLERRQRLELRRLHEAVHGRQRARDRRAVDEHGQRDPLDAVVAHQLVERQLQLRRGQDAADVVDHAQQAFVPHERRAPRVLREAVVAQRVAELAQRLVRHPWRRLSGLRRPALRSLGHQRTLPRIAETPRGWGNAEFGYRCGMSQERTWA